MNKRHARQTEDAAEDGEADALVDEAEDAGVRKKAAPAYPLWPLMFVAVVSLGVLIFAIVTVARVYADVSSLQQAERLDAELARTIASLQTRIQALLALVAAS